MKTIGRDFGDTARKVYAVASGALGNGKTVIVNSDGTVTEAGGPAQAVTNAATFSGSNQIDSTSQASVFDSNSNRIVLIYRDNSNSFYGTAIVGTVSNSSISFGTAVVIESAQLNYFDADFDSNSNKVVIGYSSGSGNQGKGIVGTVDPSDNSISFGSATNTSNGISVQQSVTFDSSTNKLAFIYRASNNRLTGRTATVSGTSISFGNEASFDDDNSTDISAAFDSNRNRVVVAYGDQGNSGRGAARVITTDSTPNASSEVQFGSANADETATVFDSNSNKIVIAYQDTANSEFGTAVVGTVAANNTISFGTPVVFESATAQNIDICFNPDLNQVLIIYADEGNSNAGTAVVGTVSETSISFTSPFVWYTGSGKGRVSYDTNINKAVISYQDGSGNLGKYRIYTFGAPNLTSENYIGITPSAYPDGAAAEIQTKGAVNEEQSGLTAGQSYFVQTDGTLGTTAGDPSVFAGTAVSATKIIVKG